VPLPKQYPPLSFLFDENTYSANESFWYNIPGYAKVSFSQGPLVAKTIFILEVTYNFTSIVEKSQYFSRGNWPANNTVIMQYQQYTRRTKTADHSRGQVGRRIGTKDMIGWRRALHRTSEVLF
jgi:hypothetical protein